MQARIAPAAYDQDIEWFIHHGDGYVDTGSFSQGQYLSPGFYTVKAEWRSQGQTGWVGCGTVTVGINDGLAPVFDASAYIGLTEQEAESRAAAERRTIRVIRVDGNYNSYTDDIVPGRIDVEIDNGVITRVS